VYILTQLTIKRHMLYVHCNILRPTVVVSSGVSRNFVQGGGVSTYSVENRENGDLGAVRVLEAAVIWYKKFHFI